VTELAPIVLFVYRRPEHARRTLAALAACPGAPRCEIHVFSDGPKDKATETGVAAVREVVREARGFRSIRLVERTEHWGLAGSVTTGVSEVVSVDGRVIVLEDDLQVDASFIGFMNRGLDVYAEDARIASIHGYVYPTGASLPATFFLRGADCWGWATWERAWKCYESDAGVLLKRLRSCPWRSEFDFNGAYPYTRMLRDAQAGRVDSWAIRWYASAFLEGMYSLYPGSSLVRNIGHDGSGTHGEATKNFETGLSTTAPPLERLEPVTDRSAFEAFHNYFLSLRPSFGTRLVRRLGDLVRRPGKG
jgi:hypothetical protein